MAKLSHRGIHDGESGLTIAPGLELIHIIFPLDVGVFWFETFIHTAVVISVWGSER